MSSFHSFCFAGLTRSLLNAVAGLTCNLPNAVIADKSHSLPNAVIADKSRSLPNVVIADKSRSLPNAVIADKSHSLPNVVIADKSRSLPNVVIAGLTRNLCRFFSALFPSVSPIPSLPNASSIPSFPSVSVGNPLFNKIKSKIISVAAVILCRCCSCRYVVVVIAGKTRNDGLKPAETPKK
jgi:hypothetical protein